MAQGSPEGPQMGLFREAVCSPANTTKKLVGQLIVRPHGRRPGPLDRPARSAGWFSVMEVGVMPKELIYSSEALSGCASTAAVEHIAVGWERDKGVQLGVVNGPPVELTINGVRSDPGLWMDLDRAQINRLIRSLRKARDAAYGQDA